MNNFPKTSNFASKNIYKKFINMLGPSQNQSHSQIKLYIVALEVI